MATPTARHAILRGVRVHNLKGVDLDLPLGKLVAITGVSGSGKSSLAFDTLYAEGQRRYVETFSAYSRQFLETLDKPDADRIDGIPPALAVAQGGARRSGRSTVGTVTEVQDYLGLLFARLGIVTCRNCGQEVRPADPGAVVEGIATLPEGTRYLIAFPMEMGTDADRQDLAEALRAEGFLRIRVDGQVSTLDAGPIPEPADGVVEVVVDRLVRGTEDAGRRNDSIETAFARGRGRCRIVPEGSEPRTFDRGWRCSFCGTEATEPEPRLFQFNSPVGACPSCEGFGRIIDLELSRIVPDPTKSLKAGAIAPWSTPAYVGWNRELLKMARKLDVAVDVPFAELTPEQTQRVVEGGSGFPGLRGFFRALESKTYKVQVRVFLARWRGYRTCPACEGARLRPEALAVTFGGRNIAEVSALTIREASQFLVEAGLDVDPGLTRRVLDPIRARLGYLDRIGLGYLTLDRQARTLSGGEAQRVSLTTALGSGLVNTLYVLDEPTTGLHPRDVGRLVEVVEGLRDAGNSVVAVEHDPAVMRAADWLVDVGPGAGEAGGRVLYAGSPDGVEAVADSATGAFLSGRTRAVVPSSRKAAGSGWIRLKGARGHNLKEVNAEFPVGLLCALTGVSGSGKSTLVEETLYPVLSRHLRGEALPAEPFEGLEVPEGIGDVLLVDQSPLGRSGRSNPVTYLKAFDEIRKAFAETHEAKARKYGPGTFSFNVEGGRCSACEGNGFRVVDMHFLPDVMVRCPECRGTRYRPEVLEVTYRGKSIAEVLELTAREAFGFFRSRPKVQSRLRPLLDVGLDYLRLGQPASTLSGGEAQRLKLAGSLAGSAAAITRQASGPKTVFLLDEPTTGLHPADTLKLMEVFRSLADLGHTVIVVEHDMDVVACADWVIDLGPEAGEAGGWIVAAGTPEAVARVDSPTGRVLAEVLRVEAPS